MANVAIVQQAKATEASPGSPTGTTVTATFASPLTPGNALYCVFTYSTGASITVTVSDPVNGNWTTLGQVVDATDTTIIGHAVFNGSISNAAAVVTVTYASAVPYRSCRIFEISGQLDGSQHAEPAKQSGPGTGANAITTGNLTPSVSGALLIASSQNSSTSSAPTVGAGMNDDGTHFVWEFGTPFERTGDKTALPADVAVAGTFTSQAAAGGDTYITVGAVFKPLGGSSPALFFAHNF